MGSKTLAIALRDDRCLFISVRRIEYRQESAHHEIIDPPLIDGHVGEVHKLFRRDDRMVIGDLRVIHKARSRRDLFIKQCPRKLPVRSHRACLQPFLNRRNDIRSQISGIRSRVGQHLMILIESLHDIQRLLCRIVEPFVRLPLKLCEVI